MERAVMGRSLANTTKSENVGLNLGAGQTVGSMRIQLDLLETCEKTTSFKV